MEGIAPPELLRALAVDVQWLWYALALVLGLIGIAGVIVPAIPGVPLVFAGMLLAAWADGFERVGLWVLLALAALTVFSVVIDFWATAVGAKRAKASTLAIVGALVGTLVGLLFGIPGLFLGPFIGAVVGELISRRRLHHADVGPALRVGVGTWVGIALGIALKLTLTMAMIGIFVLAWVV